jgi:hypothetical protein
MPTNKLKTVRRRRVKRGACVMNNERAPRGWVEIQRDDDPSCVGIGDTVFDCDEDAARAVAIAGGMPGTAFAYTETGRFYDLELRGTTVEGWPLVVVPASVARAAGLISRRRELEAYKGET